MIDTDVIGDDELPSFMNGVIALIYGHMDDSVSHDVVRYLGAYGGDVVQYMGDTVTHVITDVDIDDQIRTTRKYEPHIKIVRSQWVLDCAAQRTRLNEAHYIVC